MVLDLDLSCDNEIISNNNKETGESDFIKIKNVFQRTPSKKGKRPLAEWKKRNTNSMSDSYLEYTKDAHNSVIKTRITQF